MTVTAVDSGSKALEFLGLHEDDGQISPNKAFTSPINQQVLIYLSKALTSNGMILHIQISRICILWIAKTSLLDFRKWQ